MKKIIRNLPNSNIKKNIITTKRLIINKIIKITLFINKIIITNLKMIKIILIRIKTVKAILKISILLLIINNFKILKLIRIISNQKIISYQFIL